MREGIRAPCGTSLRCRGWRQEAALRMLMNNLDPEVAERPEDLVVYGGAGKAARSWPAYHAIVRELERLGNDETLMLKSRLPARFADVYCDRDAFTLAQARVYLEAARSAGLGLKIHADQFSLTGAALLAVELGAVSADHLEQAGEEEVRALAGSSTIATLLPGSVFHLGLDRYAPARALIDAGAAVALATDFNPGTSPVFNMQMVMSLACAEMRMTPAEAFTAATINGAHAAGEGDRTGSLSPGKRADLVIFDAADYREIPYHFGANNAILTLKEGVEIGKKHC